MPLLPLQTHLLIYSFSYSRPHLLPVNTAQVWERTSASRRVEEGHSRSFWGCGGKASFPSTSAGDLRELPMVPLIGEGCCGVGGVHRITEMTQFGSHSSCPRVYFCFHRAVETLLTLSEVSFPRLPASSYIQGVGASAGQTRAVAGGGSGRRALAGCVSCDWMEVVLPGR